MSSRSSADTPALRSPRSLAIHLDLIGGLAGDMFVAAMIDALPGLEPLVQAELAKVRPDGGALPRFTQTTRGGLRARRIELDTSAHEDHVHSGTPYVTLRARIADARLSAPTRDHALAILEWLGKAEAQVHGTSIDDVHFHELADWDSMLDVVAAGCVAGALDGARWSASALPLGGGTIRAEHGVLPVPGPATAWLATGYAWHDDGVAGERVTPTGAAILRHLVAPSHCGGPRDGGRLVAVGHGAGTRALDGVPNIVRAWIVEHATSGADEITVLEFDVDDMTGEEIAFAADRLRADPGVIDVSIGTRSGKKGRPVADFRLLVRPHAVDAVAHACFAETSTLGLRIRDERRMIVARTEVATRVGDSALSVKIARRPGGERTAKAAHDDVAATGGLAQRRRLRASGEQRALEDDE